MGPNFFLFLRRLEVSASDSKTEHQLKTVRFFTATFCRQAANFEPSPFAVVVGIVVVVDVIVVNVVGIVVVNVVVAVSCSFRDKLAAQPRPRVTASSTTTTCPCALRCGLP